MPRIFSFFTCILLLAGVLTLPAASPVRAQNQNAISQFAAALKKWERLEGTLEQTRNGTTARARLQFEAPDKLRIEIEENPAALVRAQTIVASGEETRLFDPATKRLQRLPYNITGNWWRGWNLQLGGPANLLLFGFSPEALDKLYAAQSAAGTLTLTAKPEVEARLVNDYTRFGGSGDRIFYAPLQRPSFNRPVKVVVQNKDAAQFSRSETGEASTLAMTVDLAAGLPQSASVADEKNRVVATYKYALKPRAEAFPDATFSLDLAPNQIVEDAILKPIAEYAGGDANSKFNLGVALWKHAEELPAAFAAWDDAAKISPQAGAPLIAIYEAAINSRDLGRAENALNKLGQLLGADSPEVLWRRAALAIQKRDWQGAQTSLESLGRAQPQNGPVKVLLAEALRSRGEYSRARDVLLELIKSETSQSAAQAEAAFLLAALSWNDGGEVLKLLPEANATLWQKIARAQVLVLAGTKFEPIETDNLDALAALGVLYERAGRDEEAIGSWQKIVARAPAPDDRTARLHLIALHARRGEVAPSLLQYREAAAEVPDLQTRREFQDILIAAWRKAFRQTQLRGALAQRSQATTASEDDARLWLAFQEQFGTPDEIDAAIQNGLVRFDRSAWWRARQAEFLLAHVPQMADAAARDRLQREALDYAEQAIALEPNQPYYAIQRAVVLTRNATPITAVIDAGRYEPLRKIAFAALDELLKKWPDNPDVQLAVATQRLALENVNQHEATIGLIQTALRGGMPSGLDRHFVSFSSRQVLAAALRDQKQDAAAVAQYEILFRASRTTDEELGVALNYIRFLMYQKDASGLATALMYFAHENWSFEDSQQLLQPLVNVVSVKNELRLPVLAALKGQADPYARYVAALMAANLVRSSKAILANPEAPPGAERNLQAASQMLAAALKDMETIVEGNDRVLASRAAALLGEQSLNGGDAATAEKWLARAVTIEARDINSRVALATAQLAQKKIPESLVTRDEILRTLPPTFENLSRAARLSDKIGAEGDEEKSLSLAMMAMNAGQVAPDVNPGDLQLVALLAAREALYSNKTTAATAIYNGLVNEQWNIVDRAVALIDWEETLRGMERTEQADAIAARFKALDLTPQQRNAAEAGWENLK